MRTVVTELKAQFHYNARAVIDGDERAFDIAYSIVNELDNTLDFLIDTMNFEREHPVSTIRDAQCDINDDESMEIRFYLGDVAREQSKLKSES